MFSGEYKFSLPVSDFYFIVEIFLIFYSKVIILRPNQIIQTIKMGVLLAIAMVEDNMAKKGWIHIQIVTISNVLRRSEIILWKGKFVKPKKIKSICFYLDYTFDSYSS